MPAVFVHGNPESSAIWDLLIPALDRDDVLRLSPPGFGAPVLDGFSGTWRSYRDWLISELKSIDGPIDLVGHDWGGGHVVATVTQQPELVRSWCTDIAGIFHPDYIWHDAAQVWITEGAGEENVAGMVEAGSDIRTELFQGLGMTSDIASSVAAAVNEDMARMILALYRSATPAELSDLSAGLPNAAKRPGLVLIAREDTYVGTEAMARSSADRAGAQVAVLEGLGHWWMIQDPDQGAAALQHFWNEVEGGLN